MTTDSHLCPEKVKDPLALSAAPLGLSLMLLAVVLIAGCKRDQPPAQDPPDKQGSPGTAKDPLAAVRAARAQLADADQRGVAAQEFCPISEQRLGSMGTPVKIMIKDRPVYLCCEKCRDKAMATAEDTLTAVDELKEVQGVRAKLSPEDRRLVEAQEFCVVMEQSRLGSMGAPIKLTLKDQPVFLCCKGCTKRATANPDRTLARLEELKAKAKPMPAGKN